MSILARWRKHEDNRTQEISAGDPIFPGSGSACLAQPLGAHRKRDDPKLAMSVDMEGVSGIAGADETVFGKDEYNTARKWLLSDVNACVEGACDGGATYVEVHDTHGWNKRNIPYGDLDQRAYLVKGGNLFF